MSLLGVEAGPLSTAIGSPQISPCARSARSNLELALGREFLLLSPGQQKNCTMSVMPTLFVDQRSILRRDGAGEENPGDNGAGFIADDHRAAEAERLTRTQAVGHQLARALRGFQLGGSHIVELLPVGILDEFRAVLDVQEVPGHARHSEPDQRTLARNAPARSENMAQ